MAAREMVIGKFINQIGFRIDHSTVQQVKNTVESVKSGIKTVQGVADEVKKRVNDNIDEIQKKAQKARSETEKLPEFKPGQKSTQNAKSAIDEIKDYAKKTLGVLGIGFSLTQLRSLAEEFGGINDAIRGATRELGDQSEIQQKILKGAQDCREEYGAMAGSVTKLIQQNGKLFPVDDAVKFVSLVEKLEKGAGREANIDSTMDVLTEAMSSGKLDKTGFANLKSNALAADKSAKKASESEGVASQKAENAKEAAEASNKSAEEASKSAAGALASERAASESARLASISEAASKDAMNEAKDFSNSSSKSAREALESKRAAEDAANSASKSSLAAASSERAATEKATESSELAIRTEKNAELSKESSETAIKAAAEAKEALSMLSFAFGIDDEGRFSLFAKKSIT